jgi:hypothetical protein
MIGWIKLHRKLIEKSFYRKDSEKVHLWIHLLISANRETREEMLGGKPYICNPGQFTTGRKQLAMETGISESKIERIMTYFEKIEQQIEQQKTSTNRLISILNWSEYQQTEQQIEQQVNNDRTTSEQRVNTPKEVKKIKKEKKIYSEQAHALFSDLVILFDEKLRPDTEAKKEKWLSVCEKLLKTNSHEHIKTIVKRARMDNFWSRQFLSLPKLLTSDKNDINYFVKFDLQFNGRSESEKQAEKSTMTFNVPKIENLR